ncbi:MAG: amino acid ABC transporter substrate-binding protein [Pseudomonadota bacterium]|nr:amino acid ABC transporter substrate-binding protein [Pseudomonadota bacterium]
MLRTTLRNALWAASLAATALAGPALAQNSANGGNAQGGTAAAPNSNSASPTMSAIRSRGELVCGVAGDVAGLSLPDSKGVMRGIDADGCRAVAAAILGNGDKVRFVPLTTENRFTALQSGEVDLLVRETTWTLGREANLGLLFAGINFYDGTGFLVKKSANVNSAKELDGASICVQPGTSTELAIADYFRSNKLKFTPILIESVTDIQKAFIAGRCDTYSTDESALAAFRAQQSNRGDYVLLPETISKEPLGPSVRKGDDKFFDLVRWTNFALLIAEEKGITQANVADVAKSATDPETRRLVGLEGDMGKALGVSNDWGVNVIKAVGNYGEIFDRTLAPLGVPRGINNLWNKGGLQYAPPMR